MSEWYRAIYSTFLRPNYRYHLASFCSYCLIHCYSTNILFFLQLDLIKVIASQRPMIAAASIVQRINVVFGDANQATKSPQVG